MNNAIYQENADEDFSDITGYYPIEKGIRSLVYGAIPPSNS